MLSELWQAVDDTQPNFITNLHLNHFRRQAGAHALSIFEIELHLASAALDEMKQQHRRQTLKFLIRRMLAHIQDLRHASSPFVSRL